MKKSEMREIGKRCERISLVAELRLTLRLVRVKNKYEISKRHEYLLRHANARR